MTTSPCTREASQMRAGSVGRGRRARAHTCESRLGARACAHQLAEDGCAGALACSPTLCSRVRSESSEQIFCSSTKKKIRIRGRHASHRTHVRVIASPRAQPLRRARGRSLRHHTGTWRRGISARIADEVVVLPAPTRSQRRLQLAACHHDRSSSSGAHERESPRTVDRAFARPPRRRRLPSSCAGAHANVELAPEERRRLVAPAHACSPPHVHSVLRARSRLRSSRFLADISGEAHRVRSRSTHCGYRVCWMACCWGGTQLTMSTRSSPSASSALLFFYCKEEDPAPRSPPLAPHPRARARQPTCAAASSWAFATAPHRDLQAWDLRFG